MRRFFHEGVIKLETLVWCHGMADWVPLSQTALGTIGGAPPLPLQGAPPLPPRGGDDIGQNAGMRMLLPVGRSGLAIAAGYMGLFSVLVLPAPLAIILGILAIRDIKKHPEKHGLGRAWFAIIIGGIITALVIIGIIGAAIQS